MGWTSCSPGSPAASAGLIAGVTITSVDGQNVDTASTLSTLMQRHHPGDRVSLGWTDSSGSTHTLNVQAYDYNPANAPAAQTVTITLP